MSQALLHINNFITVIKSWLLQIGTMFFSPTPANVTVKRIKEDNTLEDVVMPNLAKIQYDILQAGAVIPVAGSHGVPAGTPASLIPDPEIYPNAMQLDDDSAYVIEYDIYGYAAGAVFADAFCHLKGTIVNKNTSGTPATDVTYETVKNGAAESFSMSASISGALMLQLNPIHSASAAIYFGTAKIKKMVA